MNDYWRIRRFLGLRQLDVSLATGVPIQRLSLAEHGRLELDNTEARLVEGFLADRLECFRHRAAPHGAIDVAVGAHA